VKLYLAGPDVFRPDAHSWLEQARALSARFGFDALTPLDHGQTEPEKIFAANLALIQRAQILIANLNPFRGSEPDSGTSFEMGYALALGKRVCGYIERKESLLERVNRLEHAETPSATDHQGLSIENFGLPVNLMLAVPAQIVAGNLEDCLRALRDNPPDAIPTGVQDPLPALPDDPRIRSVITDAIRYLYWARAGRLVDARPVTTIIDHYRVTAQTVRVWESLLPACATGDDVDYLPADIVRRMKIGGRQYRSLKG